MSRNEIYVPNPDENLTVPHEFYDQWEEYSKTLPPNLVVNRFRASVSCWETLTYETPYSKTPHFSCQYAPKGTQLPDNQFDKALRMAKHLAQDNYRIIHLRQDLETIVPETWENAPLRFIEGHSWHKIPQSQLDQDFIEVEGKLWNRRDYEEAELWKTFNGLVDT